jgi:hypothetical protein
VSDQYFNRLAAQLEFFTNLICQRFQEKTALRAHLEQERIVLRSKLEILEAEISETDQAVLRFDTYPFALGENTCPHCWIDGRRALVKTIGVRSETCDQLSCSGCDGTFEVPIGKSQRGRNTEPLTA